MSSLRRSTAMGLGAWTLGLVCMVHTTGCQISEGGQTLPSAYYLHDDVQYFPAGPEFKLSREATAIREYKAAQQLQGQP